MNDEDRALRQTKNNYNNLPPTALVDVFLDRKLAKQIVCTYKRKRLTVELAHE